jgi:hypothetical protein
MLKRLVVGLLLGTVIGGVMAAVLVQGLNVWSFAVSGSVFAYLSAAVTGVVTGLVAGKPIWSADGKIEAGLKAFFGALLALGAMFALRTWAKLDVDLSMFKAGQGLVGDLPAVALPIVAALLGGFFELDNTGAAPDKAAPKGEEKTASNRKVRVGTPAATDEGDEVDEAPAKKRAR